MSDWGNPPPQQGPPGGGFQPPSGGGYQPPPGQQQYGQPPPGYYQQGPSEPPYGYPGYGGAGVVGPARASFVARMVALIVDGLIAFMVMLALVVPLVIIGALGFQTEPSTCTSSTTGFTEPCDVPTPGTIGLILALSGIGFLLYFVVLFFVLVRPVAKTGQTVGRRLMGIKVVDMRTGGTLSIGRALGRYLFAQIVSGFMYIGYLWMLWDDNSQTLHDKVVDAVVVPVSS